MSKSKMYAIHDAAAGAYLPPFFFENDLLAIRAFSALCNNPEHLFYTTPSDFVLFSFGSFDTTEGTFELEHVPRRIRSGLALIHNPTDGRQTELPLKEATHGS